VYGSFIIDIHGNKLTGKYLTSDGQIKDQFTIKKQSVSGIEGKYSFFKTVKNVKVSPNPFINTATIEYELISPSHITIDAYSLDGKSVYPIFNGKQPAGKQMVLMNAYSLKMAAGNYVLKITDGNNSSFEQLIKVN
jgi:hypothetical protein